MRRLLEIKFYMSVKVNQPGRSSKQEFLKAQVRFYIM